MLSNADYDAMDLLSQSSMIGKLCRAYSTL